MIVRREKVRNERNENMGRRNVCFLKGFERPPFVIDYEKKGRIVKR